MSTPAFENVAQLRARMTAHGLDAYIVPNADPHQTEYVHPHWCSRAWLSGFTGSAGTVALFSDKAGLWTDGRYFIQADIELKGSGIDLFRMRQEGVPELVDWLVDNIPEGGSVGVDGRLITVKQSRDWQEKLEKKQALLVTDVDLVADLWKERPALPQTPAAHWPMEYAGRSVSDKLGEIRELMKGKKTDAYVLSSLYDINWIFNIRGGDTDHTPLLTSYALVEAERATLFVDEGKVSNEIKLALDADGVDVAPYGSVFERLAELPKTAVVYLCEERVSAALRKCISCDVVAGKDLTDLPKARKNKTELDQWETVQEHDGAAMVRYWKWLEENVPQGGVDEVAAADELEKIRRSNPDCQGLSFTSISGYGSNAAMMHYSPKRGDCSVIESKGLYLIDSGGQYLGGTTDITRTFSMGELTDEQRKDYTLVLKGVINLSSARFLKGAAGNNLDILARQPLWSHGLDYKCGTGHGVGCFLNVHEGPQSFSQHKLSDTPLEPGMILTIEPGVYKEGRHGIRIENMVVVESDRETESGVFYRFRTQTLCPIDVVPLNVELMSEQEINWLNSYHAMVRERLSRWLSDAEREWLEIKTRPLPGGAQLL